MVFYKIDGIQKPAKHLAKTIADRLQNGKGVLWLVPGGSAIAVAAETAKLLRKERLDNIDNLKISLTDERYGAVGHPDSNARQLKEAGFDLPEAHFIPVLSGSNAKVTTANFDAKLKNLLQGNDYKIGLFGIGADGHTAGIKPESIAVRSGELAVNFISEDYHRITITAKAIGQLDEAVVYATGPEKHSVFDDLEADLDLDAQPAQALKYTGKLTIFNDYKGELYENRG